MLRLRSEARNKILVTRLYTDVYCCIVDTYEECVGCMFYRGIIGIIKGIIKWPDQNTHCLTLKSQ